MPKQKAKSKKPTTPAQPTAPLEGFGRFLRNHREHAGGRRQTAVADALGHEQSLISQLEAGKITNPDVEMIERIAKAYSTEGNAVSPLQVVAALVEHKYSPLINHCRASLLTLPVKDVDQIADWESAVVADELWIAAPDFVDNKNKKIREAVVAQLRKGTTIRYFVNEKDCDEGGEFTKLFWTLVEEMGGKGEWEQRLLSRPALTHIELRWLKSSFVIANPGMLFGRAPSKKDAKPEGYKFLAQDGHPEFGFQMSYMELRSTALGLQNWLDSHPQGNKNKVEAIDAGKRA
jgi:transcriptional regulator with XRE-family HTH domain